MLLVHDIIPQADQLGLCQASVSAAAMPTWGVEAGRGYVAVRFTSLQPWQKDG